MGASPQLKFDEQGIAIPKYTPTILPKKRKPRIKVILFWVVVIELAAIGAVFYFETQDSKFQSDQISRYAAKLNYSLQAGPSYAIRYPKEGPFDVRLGYVSLPKLIDRLQSKGMEIESQTRFSPELLDYSSWELFTPYLEKNRAGLDVEDCQRESMYHFRYPQRNYATFESIPKRVVQTLLFIENRDLLDANKPFLNPAVDWVRFGKAAMFQAAEVVGVETPSMGGSTLATQIEKYRHSSDGITSSIQEKLKQMASATVRAYQGGPNTMQARNSLVQSYLNTVPLSAAPGHGEVNGLGDGLWVWFGADFDETNRLLSLPDGQEAVLVQQAQALRQIIALMIAHRRPSYYLYQGRDTLETLTDSYLRLMAQANEISIPLERAALAQKVIFRNFQKSPVVVPMVTNKGINAVRTRLAGMLNVSLYDLDRMDLAATTTLQRDMQEEVSAYLKRLREPEFAQEKGLFGEHLLIPGQAGDVRYSFTLLERTPDGNRVRVQTDNTDQPFDINEGSKLELGSTAKLRVLSTYLEVIAELHQRFTLMSDAELHKIDVDRNDPLTRFVLDYLQVNSDRSLPTLLQAALDRHYSANPGEVFYSGGGQHTFHNFKKEDNGRIPSIRESLQESINLPFVRLLRDLVRYNTNRVPSSTEQLLGNDKDPRRKEYLARFADREGNVFLKRFWGKYRGKNSEERIDVFLDGLKQNTTRLSAVHRYLLPDANLETFGIFLRTRLRAAVVDKPSDKALTDREIAKLYEKYKPGAFNLMDLGYIAKVHPLELWLLGYLQTNPAANLNDVTEASREKRQEVYSWLLRTRAKNARDSRIRSMLEVEAFLDIHQRWKKLGYPFDHLVPSLATALGSSGDRPAALAELMGIILNNGVRLPSLRIDSLNFAVDTPYETLLRRKAIVGEQVMLPEVATALRNALAEVVNDGTARRIKGIYTLPDGSPLPMGGKTGTGDNRLVTIGGGGQHIASRALSRTATFVFYLGHNHFGTLTVFVPGREAGAFKFTSALPVQVLKGMASILQPYLNMGGGLCADTVKVMADDTTNLTGVKLADAKIAEIKVPEKKVPEIKVPVKKAVENKVAEKNVSAKTASEKVLEKKVLEKKAPEKKAPEKKVPEAKVTVNADRRNKLPLEIVKLKAE